MGNRQYFLGWKSASIACWDLATTLESYLSSSSSPEGFHLVENILLRPHREDLESAGPYPYPFPIWEFAPYTDSEENRELTRCKSPDHRLSQGEWILVRCWAEGDTEPLEHTCRVVIVGKDEFKDYFYVEPALEGETAGKWGEWEYYTPSEERPYPFPFLLPQANAGESLPENDPWSLRITFIFPGWHSSGRLSTDSFKDQIRKTIERETPAHLTYDILWFSKGEMSAFETQWKIWLEAI